MEPAPPARVPSVQVRASASLRLRIVAAVLLVALVLAGALLLQAAQHRDIARSQALLTEGYLPLTLEVDQLRADQQRITTDLGRLLRQERRPGRGIDSSAAIHSERLRETVQEALIHGGQALRMATDPEDRAFLSKADTSLQRIGALAETYQRRAAEVQAQLESGAESTPEMEKELRADDQALEVEIDTLSQLLETRVEKLTRSIDQQRERSTQLAVILALAGLGLAAGLIFAVLAALRPLERLTQQAQRLAAGDYASRIDGLGDNEIGVLGMEFNALAEALQQRDRRLVERADELNRLSRYLRSVLERLEDPLVVVEDGTVTLANPAAERRLSVGEGQPIAGLLADLDPGPGYLEVAHEGSRLAVRTSAFGPTGRVVLATDVTEQRRAEDALARSERLALVGQMLAQITHEVRNPLNAMSLNVEMLSDELTDLDPEHSTEAWDLLGTVSGEIDRLTRVTAHYLQLARRPPAELSPTSLSDLVHDVRRLIDAELEQQGVTLALDLTDPGPQLADGNQLRQALLNVVRNATEAGVTTLQLRLWVDPTPDGDEVVLTLIDDGPGMDPDEMERALDPFFSTKAQGTGLGLAITRQILEDHDGRIELGSVEPRGTRLDLRWPRRDALSSEPA